MSSKEQRRIYGAYYAKHREEILAKGRAKYAENREEQHERSRAYYAKHPGHYRSKQYRRLYGMDIATYENLRALQGGVCALCHQPPAEGKLLEVDHDHQTGRVRGLLCHGCNWSIGVLGDSADSIKRVLEYLSSND